MERKKIKPLTQTQKEFLAYSKGIADSDLMNQERNFTQHRGTTVYEHSIGVAYTSYFIAKHMPFSFREASLVKGALLHDYFFYMTGMKKMIRINGMDSVIHALR